MVKVAEDEFTITAKLEAGKEIILPGQQGLIVEYQADKDYYLLTPFEL